MNPTKSLAAIGITPPDEARTTRAQARAERVPFFGRDFQKRWPTPTSKIPLLFDFTEQSAGPPATHRLRYFFIEINGFGVRRIFCRHSSSIIHRHELWRAD